MENKTLLSIIITAYNEEKYLSTCVDSIINSLGDDFPETELIISNNNSTDRTLEIANSYAKKYQNIFVYTSTKQGPSVARNTGLENATGEYVTFIDGDDYVDSNIKEVYASIKKNPTIDIFQYSYIIHKAGKILTPELCPSDCTNKELQKTEFLNNLSLNAAFSSSSSRAVKLKIIQELELRYDERFMQMEDMEFSVRLINSSNTFMFLTTPYYHYEIRTSASLTAKISLKRMLQGLSAAATSIDYLKKNTTYSKCPKLFKFVSLLSYSLIRRTKDLSKEEQNAFIRELKINKQVLDYPHFLSTKLFYAFYKIFGLKLALKFV